MIVPSFGFAGVLSSGKSEYVKGLKELLEKEFKIKAYTISFSDVISEVAKERYGMTERNRRILQSVGNEERKNDPTIWAKRVIERIYKEGSTPVLIDSIRMPEEAVALRHAFSNLYVVKLVPGSEEARMAAHKAKYGREPTKEELMDNSDRHIDQIKADIVLTNTYKKIDMEWQLKSIVKAIKKGTFPNLNL